MDHCGIEAAKADVKAAELCRKHAISQATLYNWKAKYCGMEPSQLRRFKELETENNRLKRMYADLSLTHHALQDAVQKKGVAPAQRTELVQLMVNDRGLVCARRAAWHAWRVRHTTSRRAAAAGRSGRGSPRL
jgi:putative transposase